MTIANQPLLSIRLSFEELQLVMGLVKAPALHGVRPPTGPSVTVEQAAHGLICAERSLRARELAAVSAEGTLVVHVALLSAVGVCGYPERALLVQHVTPLNELVEYTGAQRGDAAVGLRAVEAGVYEVTVLDEAHGLVDEALNIAGCQRLVAARPGTLVIEDAALARVRELAEAGAVDASAAQLCAAGADQATARALAEVLAAPHALSVLHADAAAWSMVASAEHPGAVLLAPIDTAELSEQLLQTFAVPASVAA